MENGPRLLVKESEKTLEWVENYANFLHQKSMTGADRKQDITCWAYYHNKINPSDTEYLTKIGDSYLPANVRRIPRQRTYLDRLSSQQQRRPFVFSCVLTDKNSIEEKYLDQIKDYVDAIDDQAQYVHFETTFQISEIKNKIQDMQGMVQKQPASQQEASQIAEMKKALPKIMNDFQYAITMLEKKDALTTEQVESMKDYHKRSKKDWKEIAAQNTILKLRQELDINTESTASWINGMVVGREAYYVDYIEGNRLPVFKALDPLTIAYPLISSVKWIQDGPWVTLTDYTSFTDIVIRYGQQIENKYGKGKLDELENTYSENTASMVTGDDTGAYFDEGSSLYNGSDSSTYGLKVERIWFKVPRNIKVKYSPNPFEEGTYFRHFIQNKEIINGNEWKYDYESAIYINKKNPKDIRQESEVEVLKKNETYTTKYTNDLYSAVIVNNELIVDAGKVPLVLRDIDRHGKINLPVFGKTYSSNVDQPYSLILATKDIQDLYDIVNYHQELMLALAGTKTILFDAAFKPTTMDDADWEADKKKGVINIETFGHDGKKPQSSFNQWTMFDLSVSNSIGVLDGIKKSLDETMGDVIGVPYSLKGQVIATDQVGTYNASIKQAGLVTEIRYAEHDLIEGKALSHCLNLALTYCYKDGETFGINHSDLSGDIVRIPANVLNKVRFSVIMADNTEEQQGVEDLKQLIVGDWKAGQLKFTDVVDLWGIKTLCLLKERAKTLADKAEKIQQMSAANAQQADVEKEKLKIQLNNELLAPWKDQENKLAQMELSIKQHLGELQAKVLSEKNALLQQQVEKQAAVKTAKIESDSRANDTAVAMNDKHQSNDEQIRMLEIQVNSLLQHAKLTNDDMSSRRKFHTDSHRNFMMRSQREQARGGQPVVQ